MWQFHNPVQICFGSGTLKEIKNILQGRCYAIVTYPNAYFDELAKIVKEAAEGCAVVLNQVHENPDLEDLAEICQAFKSYQADVEVLVALGGGSVIDTTKALAVAGSEPQVVVSILKNKSAVKSALPIIAIPTTTGTGSEVTSWATLWDKRNSTKYSLSDVKLYPAVALCDPHLTLQLPVSFTIHTGLDALSHAMESLWNKNRNPVSFQFAKRAIQLILPTLPALILSPQDLSLRETMMLASLNAGLAFSNTKTSIAHNISYGVTLGKNVPHGIACAFTLPIILRSFAQSEGDVAHNLRAIFGADLVAASKELNAWIAALGIKTTPQDYGYSVSEWQLLLSDALKGARGQNFSGNSEQLHALFQAQIETTLEE